MLYLLFLWTFIYYNSLSSSNFCTCYGVWADPFVPTAILGETHFSFPLLLVIYSYLNVKANYRTLNIWDGCLTTKLRGQIFFPIYGLVGSFLLKMASSPSYLPAASLPFPLLSPPPLPPRQTRGSPGLRLASLHPIRIARRACDVTYVFDLSYAWTDMWTGCGGSV